MTQARDRELDRLVGENKRLHERCVQLEGHRAQWRRRAWYLGDLIREGKFEAAREAVDNWGEESPA